MVQCGSSLTEGFEGPRTPNSRVGPFRVPQDLIPKHCKQGLLKPVTSRLAGFGFQAGLGFGVCGPWIY